MSESLEAQLYDHANRLIQSHETLLADGARNRAFFRALKAVIRPGMHVLDIGAGTGIWAVAAAMLGAARAVAVEMDPMLIRAIQALAEENGVAHRVQAFAGHSSRLQFDKEFDLVITETIGNLAFEEQIVPTIIDARSRFLKTGGILIPESVSLLAAPVHLPDRILPLGIPIDAPFFHDLMLHSPVELEKKQTVFLSPERELIAVDLYSVEAPPSLLDLSATWKIHGARRVNGFVTWAAARLTTGIRLSALKTSSWKQTVYRIKPFTQTSGNLEFRLSLTPETNHWSATLIGRRREERSYSPSVAASMLAGSEPARDPGAR